MKDDFKLNDGQEKCLTFLTEIIKQIGTDGDDDFIEECIIGKPGTGKTTLIIHFIKVVELSNLGAKVYITAPTHKALSVIRRSFDKYFLNGMNIEFKTIHSLLGLKCYRYEGKEIFEQGNATDYDTDGLLIVDEASMINSDLLQLIRESGFTKIIYLGDASQLPPVGQTESPALNLSDLRTHELTKVERQSDTPIITDLLDSIREAIRFNNVSLIRVPAHSFIKGEKGSVEVVDPKGIKAMLNNLSKGAFQKGTNHENSFDSMVIAYTNDRVSYYNRVMRRNMNGGKQLEEFNLGESVIVGEQITKIVTDSSGKTDKEKEITVFRQQDLAKITHVDRDSDGLVEFYNITLSDGDKEANVKVLHSNSISEHRSMANDLADIAKEAKAKDSMMTKQYWTDYWEWRDMFSKITPTYALTSHKSQGSPYEVGVVDVANIFGTCREVDQALRALYVACSRARSSIILINPKAITQNEEVAA